MHCIFSEKQVTFSKAAQIYIPENRSLMGSGLVSPHYMFRNYAKCFLQGPAVSYVHRTVHHCDS